MKEISWNGGYYREGGTVICHGEVKTVKHLDIFIEQKTPNIFDRKRVLRVETTDGNIIEIE